MSMILHMLLALVIPTVMGAIWLMFMWYFVGWFTGLHSPSIPLGEPRRKPGEEFAADELDEPVYSVVDVGPYTSPRSGGGGEDADEVGTIPEPNILHAAAVTGGTLLLWVGVTIFVGVALGTLLPRGHAEFFALAAAGVVAAIGHAVAVWRYLALPVVPALVVSVLGQIPFAAINAMLLVLPDR